MNKKITCAQLWYSIPNVMCVVRWYKIPNVMNETEPEKSITNNKILLNSVYKQY